MGVKMMRWRPWPPLTVRKFDVKLLVHRLIGGGGGGGGGAVAVEVRWKGGKTGGLGSTLRRNAAATRRRDLTAEVVANGEGEDSVLQWEEEFRCVCNLSAYGGNGGELIPWEIGFTFLINNNNGSKQGAKTKAVALGTASLNLTEYAYRDEEKEFELNIPINMSGSNAETQPLLSVTLSLSEVKPAQDNAESIQKSIASVISPPLSGETSPSEKDELSALQAGLRKVKILTEFVASRRVKKAFRAEGSSRSDDGDCIFSFDSDSLDEFEEGDSDEGKEDCTVRKSCSYGTLAYANAGGSFVSSARINVDDEDWVYYSNRRSDVGCLVAEDSSASAAELPPVQYSRRSILPWRKRKLSFRSPKTKGEPLLKKAYGEEGGDDIDFDRRQLSSDESSYGWHKSDEDSLANRLIVSEFGDDSFAVGSWEPKEIINRDGYLKLETEVFFASIDQRSERAAGESACTALVAVIADWLHTNRDIMPIKSQFDSLIRDGSLEWRRLCENETYMERFPDKHFDLETVLQAKIRQLSVDPGKSFIGFFHPDGIDEDRFDLLQGAMSFDGIWDEISSIESNSTDNVEQPHIYIVSWNDHFFVLKVEKEAYYIIDTLGERLFEGCNQAYILKFDKSTKISKLPVPAQSPGRKPPTAENETVAQATSQPSSDVEPEGEEEKEELLCQGRESCKEYMKSFLAAIPIRELLADLKKGLMASTPLHHRLQIEFHYTQFLSSTGTEASIVQDRPVEIPITDVSA
ncbi:hypothetical protein Droror1_Dr00026013 [Drosera rotundifolia]